MDADLEPPAIRVTLDRAEAADVVLALMAADLDQHPHADELRQRLVENLGKPAA